MSDNPDIRDVFYSDDVNRKYHERAAFRRGAEAMREAAAKACTSVLPEGRTIDRFVVGGQICKNADGEDRFVSLRELDRILTAKADAIRALPLPEAP